MEVPGRRASAKQRSESDEERQRCDPCYADGRTRSPAGYCMDCSEYLCSDCYRIHLRPSPSKHHKLLDKYNMPTEKIPPVEICLTHKDEQIKWFCRKDKTLVCNKCLMNHENCTPADLCSISEALGDQDPRELHAKLETKIRRLEGHLEDIKQGQIKNKTKVQKNKHEAKSAILSQCKTMRGYVDRIQKEAEIEVDQIEQKDIKKIDDALTKCEQLTNNLKEMKVENNRTPNRKEQDFIITKKTETRLKSLVVQMETLSSGNKVREYTYEANAQLKDLVRKKTKLGHVTMKHTTDTAAARSSDRKMKTHDIETASGILENRLDLGSSDITGCTVLKAGRNLALADNNNKCILLYDLTEKRVAADLCPPNNPWDITEVQGQLAVTLPTSETIIFITVKGSSMLLDREIKVSGQCYGIDGKDHNLFVSFISPHAKVQIISMSGSMLYQFKTENLLFSPCYLTLSYDKTLVYVSNKVNNTIVCMTTNGVVKAVYKNRDLRGPTGLATADDGTVFVCGSNNIHMISALCITGRVFMDKKHGIQDPRCIAYHNDPEELYVGEYFREKMKVFKIV